MKIQNYWGVKMEIREGNVIINIDQQLEGNEEQLVKDCAVIIDAVITSRRNDFNIVAYASFSTVLDYILAMLAKEGK